MSHLELSFQQFLKIGTHNQFLDPLKCGILPIIGALINTASYFFHEIFWNKDYLLLIIFPAGFSASMASHSLLQLFLVSGTKAVILGLEVIV